MNDRHDKPLRCRYDALSVVTHDKVILGDKKESRERYAQWNATHVPDIIHVRLATDELLEVKVVSPLTKTRLRQKWRQPLYPSAVGHVYALGNTLEKLSLKVFGVPEPCT